MIIIIIIYHLIPVQYTAPVQLENCNTDRTRTDRQCTYRYVRTYGLSSLARLRAWDTLYPQNYYYYYYYYILYNYSAVRVHSRVHCSCSLNNEHT